MNKFTICLACYSTLLCGLLFAMAGCSSSGGSLGIFPSGHFLNREVKELALATQDTSHLPRELGKTVLHEYIIQPGDILLVESTDFDSFIRFPGDQEVLPDGTIDLGKYGRLIVAGMTLEEIEFAAEQQIERFEEEEVEPINVRLVGAESVVYYVLGEVNAPGSYPLIGRETTLDAILMAGGITDRASGCDIVLARPTCPNGCRVVLPICYDNITQLGDSTTNYQVLPGDRIYVGTKRVEEELMFWQEQCEHCNCPPQSPCPDPAAAPIGLSFAKPNPLDEPTHSPPTESHVDTNRFDTQTSRR